MIKLKKADAMLIVILIVGATTLAVNLISEEDVVLTHCGAGQYLDIDANTCLLKSSIQPEIVIEEKIIIETIPLKIIKGTSSKQNIFIVDNGENPTVFLQQCKGLSILNNPIITTEDDGSFTLRDSVAGVTIFVDKRSTYQYQISTVPYSGQSFNTVGTELTRSDMFKIQCEEEVVKEETSRDEFYFNLELTDRDTVLEIEGDIGRVVGNNRSITGMVVQYENGSITAHMESFTINLDYNGEFSETIDVDGISDSGKRWYDNETYRVIVSYDGDQETRDFRK